MYVVGIDLGTTHCVVARAAIAKPAVKVVDIPQLVAPGEVAERPLLPSFTYLPAEGELAEHDKTLPWGTEVNVVGELARKLGARSPGRLVSSAKSWICYGGVNRKAAILPWGAPDDAAHLSPFDAQVAYLAHLRAAWDRAFPAAPLASQDVVVTVPASFDESARELTVEAATKAGLTDVRLLEEPQAAFYDFIGEHPDALADAKLVLVVDVGGGTTDLTLVRVKPQLERIAVGGHLMLGGDNMDAALAHHVLEVAGQTKQLDPTEWAALVQSARDAKERLLAVDAPDEVVVTMQSRSSRLIGGTRSIIVKREDARRILVDGFMPRTGMREVADRATRPGLTTLGLPYVTDPAIPRHVGAFLRKHAHAAAAAGARVDDGLPRPDAVLLNGGVFNAPALVERFSEVLAGWFGAPVRLLAHTSLDTAVARGAARYALARRGVGQVIHGGSARAYYIGIDDAHGVRKALCIAPRGMEEGVSVDIPERVLELAVDKRVAFPLYGSTDDTVDAAGTVIDAGNRLEAFPSLEAVLRGKNLHVRLGGGVPVRLTTRLAENGTLAIHLVTVQLPPQRWQLTFGSPTAGVSAPEALKITASKLDELPERFNDGRRLLERLYASAEADPANLERVKNLRHELDDLLGPRGEWSASTCRAIADVLLERSSNRGRSDQHELAWLRTIGWCLRPGIGVEGDEVRITSLWRTHDEGLKVKTKGNWSEWWITFRRVASGLSKSAQQALFTEVALWLDPRAKVPQGPRVGGSVEMMQMVAALERVPGSDKERAGAWVANPTSWLVLGRLGNRYPSTSHEVVRKSVAEEWLVRILGLDWEKAEGASFAAVLLARRAEDSAHDVDAALRTKVSERLSLMKAPGSWLELLTKPGATDAKDAARILGDSLPAGLRLT
ncbi:MAG: Hsp70 family protein [Clostridia bacterium]|nr:Hsp70 family protein [Deltaproteobacteria bacterium]